MWLRTSIYMFHIRMFICDQIKQYLAQVKQISCLEHKYIYFICEVSLYCIYDVPYIEFSSKMHYWFLSLHIVTHGTFFSPISYSFIVSHTYRYLTPCNCTYLDIHRITYMPTTAHFSKFSSFCNMCRRRHAPGLTNIYFLTFIRLRSNHVAPYFESIIIYYFS